MAIVLLSTCCSLLNIQSATSPLISELMSCCMLMGYRLELEVSFNKRCATSSSWTLEVFDIVFDTHAPTGFINLCHVCTLTLK